MPISALPIETDRYRFTIEQYHRMVETGVLSEHDRVELINGEIMQMTPIGGRHIAIVMNLDEDFRDLLGKRCQILVQCPIRCNDQSEPQPDLALLKRRDDRYVGHFPLAEDVLLLIEVSDSSIIYDKETKIPFYASQNIPEVWIVNLKTNQLEIYREPSVQGYLNEKVLNRDDRISPSAFPDCLIPVEIVLRG